MKSTEKKIYHVSTSGDSFVTEDGYSYSTTICLEKSDRIISWSFDDPFDLNKADFENIATPDDLYRAINNMCVLFEYPDGYFEETLKIDDMNDVVSITVKVDIDICDFPDGKDVIYECFDTGCAGYNFINKKLIGKACDIDEMIDELTEYAENSGFKDYYNKAIKGKTEEEIRKLYLDVFGK